MTNDPTDEPPDKEARDPWEEMANLRARLVGPILRAMGITEEFPRGTRTDRNAYEPIKQRLGIELRAMLKIVGIDQNLTIQSAELHEGKGGRKYAIVRDASGLLWVANGLQSIALGGPVAKLSDLKGPFATAGQMAVEMSWNDAPQWEEGLREALDLKDD